MLSEPSPWGPLLSPFGVVINKQGVKEREKEREREEKHKALRTCLALPLGHYDLRCSKVKQSKALGLFGGGGGFETFTPFPFSIP